MKSLFVCFLACLVVPLGAQVNKIKDAGPDNLRINFAIVGDGYTAAQLGDFANDCQSITTDFFNEVPFANYTNFFNVHTVDVVSAESGADHPNVDGHGGTQHPTLDVNTALNGRFDAYGLHRLVVIDNNLAFAELAANYPGYDQAIVLVNSPHYGGSGGATAVNTLDAAASDLALHEVGHSFQGLQDEYDSGANWEAANLTSVDNAGNVSWQAWIGEGGVGEFPRGTQMLKPVNGTCMMEYLSEPFCPVCVEQTIERIYTEVSPLETTSPATANVSFTGDDLPFAITTIKPVPNTLTYAWELDGQPLAAGTESITLTGAQITQPSHTLLVRVTDATALSKKNTNYVFTYEWTVTDDRALPLSWATFTAVADGKVNQLDWTVADATGVSHFLIERREDNRWTTLDRTPFAGANYRYYDEFPLPGTNHYRIRSVDLDGSELFSPIREVRGVARTYFRAYPSVTAGPVAVEVFTEAAADTRLRVVDANGRVVRERLLTTPGGWLAEGLDFTDLAPGTYVVEVTASRERYQTWVVRR